MYQCILYIGNGYVHDYYVVFNVLRECVIFKCTTTVEPQIMNPMRRGQLPKKGHVKY